jgi:oligopeptide/dipeptide ABC transporter ATP-binding protein
LLQLSDHELTALRGRELCMIFQNPMSSLNPVWPIGDQVTEGLRVHHGKSAKEARDMGVELLRRVGIASPERRIDDYPHQWSGGMLQRAAIAMAMAGPPTCLFADEPTTALDVTIQDQILALLMELQESTGMTLILVSHDLAVIAETCDQLAVMYAGNVVECGPTKTIFQSPMHPYTLGLLQSTPHLAGDSDRLRPIAGQPPDLANLGPGCSFAPRCAFASPECWSQSPTSRELASGHFSACLFPERVSGGTL